MTDTHLIRGECFLATWKANLLSGIPPTRWPLAHEDSALFGLSAAPGEVIVIGGAPGSCKTALVSQLVFDGLLASTTLKVLIANVEMATAVLFDRQLARLAGVDLTMIRCGVFSAHDVGRLDRGFRKLEIIAPRLGFCSGPFTLKNVADAADEFGPDIIVLDYIQRFSSSSAADRRGGVDQSMSVVRQFANAGSCVFVISALARQKNRNGQSTYSPETLSLAAFRDSSELEFGADDAYILTQTEGTSERILRHLKSRHGECRDIVMDFDGSWQSFTGDVIDETANLVRREVSE